MIDGMLYGSDGNMYAPFDAGGLNFDIRQLVEARVQALKKCLHDWGVIIRAALRAETGLKPGSQLYQALSFRVYPSTTKQVSGTVKLMVGVLDPESDVLRYLKFFVYGSRKHFVPIRDRDGISTGILQWALDKGLVEDAGGKYVWVGGEYAGKTFTGIPNFHNVPNNFFQRVYDRYYSQVQNDIRIILSGQDVNIRG
jgi:hypothetical protein